MDIPLKSGRIPFIDTLVAWCPTSFQLGRGYCSANLGAAEGQVDSLHYKLTKLLTEERVHSHSPIVWSGTGARALTTLKVGSGIGALTNLVVGSGSGMVQPTTFSSSDSLLLVSMSTRNRLRVQALERGLVSDDINDQAQLMRMQLDLMMYSKKGRGITEGISVEKKRRKMEKLEVTIHPKRRRVVGDNAKEFKTEACVVLKQHAPLQYTRLKDIPIDSKKKMWLAINKDKEEILHKPPNGVSKEDWKKLIHNFESDGFQEISDRNKENRKKLKMAHTCGTKSIAQYCYEDRDPEIEQEPTRIATWRKTRYSNKKNGWVDQTSQEVYDDITRLQSQASEAGQELITEDEAFIKVLGPEKSSQLRGCGDGLKPPSKQGGRINDELIKENEELRNQAEEDRECLESFKKKITRRCMNAYRH
ncbi:UNVERIFIED_CONTAM: hypothetical protein Sradi_4054200 [Sesamum radiatum]|uniref:Uncharacterized protein n=1 Tax=Sesamum radiatum TaxID=300843 RepID=A0AAW2PLX2_SESRA